MKYEADFLEQLREKARLSEVVGQKVRLQKKGREFVGLCPFHKEKTPSFFVSDQKASYHCFGCGASGDIFGFLTDCYNYTFSDAVEEVARLTHSSLPEQAPSTPEQAVVQDQKQIQLKLHEEVCAWYQQQLISSKGLKARDYLSQRGMKEQIIQKFRLGYAPSGNSLMSTFTQRGYSHDDLISAGFLVRGENGLFDRFRDRLMFPIFSPKGQVIAFGGRILGQGQPKYMNSPETLLFHKKYTL
jgi:DNA primase